MLKNNLKNIEYKLFSLSFALWKMKTLGRPIKNLWLIPDVSAQGRMVKHSENKTSKQDPSVCLHPPDCCVLLKGSL